jgi:hypothetical protein
MRQQGNILVKSVTPPSYVDDPPIQLTVLNLSEREEDVEVAGRRVTVPARGEATIEVPSPKTPGDYYYRLQVRWRDGEVTVPVTYSIPRPIQVVQQVGIVKDGVGKIRVAFALRKPEAHRVKVSVAGIPSLRRTLTAGRDFTLRMNAGQQDRLSGTPMGGGVRELVGGGRGAPAAEIGCHHPRSHSRAEQQAGRLPLNQKT